ncbi:MAG TPA: glycosyltransferase family 4 protein [Candidatus Binatia bacterium]
MRVAHIGNYKPDSANGVDKTIAGLMRHLPEQGIKVEVWHPSRRVTRIERRIEGGVLVYDLPVRRPFKGLCLFTAETVRFVRSRAQAMDLLHFHSVFLSENLRIASIGIPYVVTPHGGYDELVLSGRNRAAKAIWLKLWERPYLEKARLIQAVSVPELQGLQKLGLRTPLRYVANGIEDCALQLPAPPPSMMSDLVFLGRLAVEQKGLDLLIKGYAMAAARNHNLPRLVLAGPDFRDGRAQLAAMAEALSISGKVEFAGPLHGEQKWQALSQARVFVHTSRREGMPFALLEAMALGRPTLVTPGTNLADAIAGAKAGFVTECEAGAIADAVCTLAAQPSDTIDTMGERARALVKTQFSWRSIAATMGDAYRGALAD